MVEQYSDPERMAKFETTLENIVMVVTKMDAKIDTWQASFVSKELLEEKLKTRDAKIERLEKENEDLQEQLDDAMEEIKEDKNTTKHILPLWGSVVVSLVAIFITLWSLHK